MTTVDELVARSTAVVNLPGARAAGSAFRIAPRFAVTAGHVVENVDGGTHTEVWLDFGPGGRCRARVAEVSQEPPPGRASWPFPDLAVLALEPNTCPLVPSVAMSEILPEPGGPVRLAGMAVPFDPDLLRVSTADGRYAHAKPFLGFTGTAVLPGRSGGPLFSPEIGAVLGVVKGTADTRIPNGGLATPLLAGLRAMCTPELYSAIVTDHDRCHAVAVSPWHMLRMPGRQPDEMRRLFRVVAGLLARLAPARRKELNALHRMLCGDIATDSSEAEGLRGHSVRI